MIFDARQGVFPECGKPCYAYDAVTGEYVPMVFYYDDESHEVRRHVPDENGLPYFEPGTHEVSQIVEKRELIFTKEKRG